MDKNTRILIFALSGTALAAGATLLFRRQAKKREIDREGIVYIGRSQSDDPIVSCDEIHLYEGKPITFLTDPEDPDLDWVVTITDPKGTPFAHGNGKPQAIFTPVSNTSEITAKRPAHGKHDDYKYTVSLSQYGTELDPKLIIH
jgi:hypothetical protein